MLLEQGSRVFDRVVARGDEFMSQMSSIMNSQTGPAINIVDTRFKARGSFSKCINTVIMTTSTIDNVPRKFGVVKTVGVGLVVIHGCEALIVVDMTKDGKIDVVLVKSGLEGVLALPADILSAGVPWSVTSNNDPRSLATVNGGQILVEPIDLLIGIRTERLGIFVTRTVWLIRSNNTVAEVGFGVDLDKMDHAVVVRVPHVFFTT